MAAILRRASIPKHGQLFSSSMAATRRSFSSYLVTPTELNEALDAKTSSKPIPVCASWFLPNDPEKRTGRAVFEKGHIPGARFFDLDKVSDTSSSYPHMLPTPKVFQEALSELGITNGDRVVVYDSAELGIFSAPRVAWTFKMFGHESVHVLNNFKLWVEQGFPVEAGEQEKVERSAYELPQFQSSKVANFEQVRELAEKHIKGQSDTQILDARSLGRWKGTDPEPRPGLPSGHMPGSVSVPVPELLDPKTKTLLPADKLREVFKQKGVTADRPIITSCGTGVTAAVIDAALTEAGFHADRRRLYDGSWTEWAQRATAAEGLIVSEK